MGVMNILNFVFRKIIDIYIFVWIILVLVKELVEKRNED